MRGQFMTGGRLLIVANLAALLLGCPACAQEGPPPDATWTADAEVVVERTITDLGLGAVQGVVVRDGKVYAYGDLMLDRPRVGIIKEYTFDLDATGRAVRLTRRGEPKIIHPTGLTWHPKWGTLLGDTVRKKGIIYRLDWDRAWVDGNLDNAIVAEIDDDVAINGCRPQFVELGGRSLLATSDYGDEAPELRLYDPESLFSAGRSSATGVVLHRLPIGPFNQNMAWDSATGRLTCVQNVVAGRGWRLDVLDLSKAVAGGGADASGVRTLRQTFAPHDELEGYWPLGGERALFAIARRRDNVFIGSIKSIEPRVSPPVASPAPVPASSR
jgi:hypothetical protein